MSLAYMVWAITIRHGAELPSDSNASGSLRVIISGFLLKTMVMGPIGAALSLVWERDHLVWQSNATSQEKETKGRPRRMSRKWMFS